MKITGAKRGCVVLWSVLPSVHSIAHKVANECL